MKEFQESYQGIRQLLNPFPHGGHTRLDWESWRGRDLQREILLLYETHPCPTPQSGGSQQVPWLVSALPPPPPQHSHSLALPIPPGALHLAPMSSPPKRLLRPPAPSTKQKPLHTLRGDIQRMCPGLSRPLCCSWHPLTLTAVHAIPVVYDFDNHCSTHSYAHLSTPITPQPLPPSSQYFSRCWQLSASFLIRPAVPQSMVLKGHHMFDE